MSQNTYNRQQIEQLVEFVKKRHPGVGWSLVVRPETFAVLGTEQGELAHPTAPRQFAPLAIEVIGDVEVDSVNLKWDIALAALTDQDGNTLPSDRGVPCYYMDLTTDQIEVWTASTGDVLTERYNTN